MINMEDVSRDYNNFLDWFFGSEFYGKMDSETRREIKSYVENGEFAEDFLKQAMANEASRRIHSLLVKSLRRESF